MVVKPKCPLANPKHIQEILAKATGHAPVEVKRVPVKLPPPRKKPRMVLTVDPPDDAEAEAAELEEEESELRTAKQEAEQELLQSKAEGDDQEGAEEEGQDEVEQDLLQSEAEGDAQEDTEFEFLTQCREAGMSDTAF